MNNKKYYHLFSYGTLQLESVQIETFGRILDGNKDMITGWRIDKIEITDPEVLRKSAQPHHPILRRSDNTADKVEGTVFKITQAELAHADDYEVDDYKRVKASLASGGTAWVYVAASDT